jgi:hypothetical protein
MRLDAEQAQFKNLEQAGWSGPDDKYFNGEGFTQVG